jgi:hypothetical protein
MRQLLGKQNIDMKIVLGPSLSAFYERRVRVPPTNTHLLASLARTPVHFHVHPFLRKKETGHAHRQPVNDNSSRSTTLAATPAEYARPPASYVFPNQPASKGQHRHSNPRRANAASTGNNTAEPSRRRCPGNAYAARLPSPPIKSPPPPTLRPRTSNPFPFSSPQSHPASISDPIPAPPGRPPRPRIKASEAPFVRRVRKGIVFDLV